MRPDGALRLWLVWCDWPLRRWTLSLGDSLHAWDSDLARIADVSIYAPFEANWEEVAPPPQKEFCPLEGDGFKPGFVFEETRAFA